MTSPDIGLNATVIDLANITGGWGPCDCAGLCNEVMQKMFTPLLLNSLLSFALVVSMAILYVKMPRSFRKDIVEKNPNFFLRHVTDIILILLVSTGWLAGGVVVYVIGTR